MPLQIIFIIEANGTNLKLYIDTPGEEPITPSAAETAAVDLARFLQNASKIWLDTQDKSPEQCKAHVDNLLATKH